MQSQPSVAPARAGHFRWRAEYKTDGILAEDFSDMDAAGMLRWHRPCKEGDPPAFRIVVSKLASLDPKDRERMQRFFVYSLERGLCV